MSFNLKFTGVVFFIFGILSIFYDFSFWHIMTFVAFFGIIMESFYIMEVKKYGSPKKEDSNIKK